MDQEMGSIASPPDVATVALTDGPHKGDGPHDTTEASWTAREEAGSCSDEGATHRNGCEADISKWFDLDGFEGNVWDDAIPLGYNAAGKNSPAPRDYTSIKPFSSAYLDLAPLCSPERFQEMMSGDDSNVWIEDPNEEDKEIADPEQEQEVARIPQQIPELASLRLQLEEHPAPTAPCSYHESNLNERLKDLISSSRGSSVGDTRQFAGPKQEAASFPLHTPELPSLYFQTHERPASTASTDGAKLKKKKRVAGGIKYQKSISSSPHDFLGDNLQFAGSSKEFNLAPFETPDPASQQSVVPKHPISSASADGVNMKKRKRATSASVSTPGPSSETLNAVSTTPRRRVIKKAAPRSTTGPVRHTVVAYVPGVVPAFGSVARCPFIIKRGNREERCNRPLFDNTGEVNAHFRKHCVGLSRVNCPGCVDQFNKGEPTTGVSRQISSDFFAHVRRTHLRIGRIICECGAKLSRHIKDHVDRHNRSSKHMEYLLKVEQKVGDDKGEGSSDGKKRRRL
ncbi:hypothetical protein DFH11DRAFT_1546747 [Phellopilus nigrolimitatus]|nr:hypothetical protein DFH11DRAFT_1546747 [Phellopilus nigrolimitatus]